MLVTLKRQLKRIRERLREGAAEGALETDELTDEERLTALTRIRVEAWREMGYMAGSSHDEIWQRAHELALRDMARADRMRASAARK
jgi:hypothetical protein